MKIYEFFFFFTRKIQKMLFSALSFSIGLFSYLPLTLSVGKNLNCWLFWYFNIEKNLNLSRKHCAQINQITCIIESRFTFVVSLFPLAFAFAFVFANGYFLPTMKLIYLSATDVFNSIRVCACVSMRMSKCVYHTKFDFRIQLPFNGIFQRYTLANGNGCFYNTVIVC